MAVEYKLHRDFLEASYVHRDKNFFMPKMHYHLSHELIIVESGTANMMSDDKMYSVSGGELLLIPKDTLHKNVGGSAHTRYAVNFSEDYLSKYFSPDAMREILSGLCAGRYCMTDHAFHRCLSLSYRIVYSEFKYLYLAEMLSLFTDKANFRPPEETPYAGQINAVLKYINDNYAILNGLDDIADTMHISKSYLCQLVKRTTGLTVSEYINGVRINRACALLREGRLNISETADACGFDSVSSFGKVFRKTVNLSPTEFKKAASAE